MEFTIFSQSQAEAAAAVAAATSSFNPLISELDERMDAETSDLNNRLMLKHNNKNRRRSYDNHDYLDDLEDYDDEENYVDYEVQAFSSKISKINNNNNNNCENIIPTTNFTQNQIHTIPILPPPPPPAPPINSRNLISIDQIEDHAISSIQQPVLIDDTNNREKNIKKFANDFIRNELLSNCLSLDSRATTSRAVETNFKISSNFSERIIKTDEKLMCISPAYSSLSSSSASSEFSSYSSSPEPTQMLASSLHMPELFNCLRVDPNSTFNSSALAQSLLQNEEFCFKPISNLLKYDLNCLNLTRKDTILFLIERNQSHNLNSPFDQFAYTRLKTNITYNHLNSNKQNNYNYHNIKKISKLKRKIGNPLDKNFIKKNTLMPNCISTFTMPFFFDLFKMNEMQLFDKQTLDMMLNLKRAYDASNIYLDYDSLTCYSIENILWNCLIMYKFKLNHSRKMRMGYFNYYLSYIYMLIHYEKVIISNQNSDMNQQQEKIVKEHLKKSFELNYILPYLLESLILTGCLTPNDLIYFKRFYNNKMFGNENRTSYNLENIYLINSMRSLMNRMDTNGDSGSGSSITAGFPMKLKNLCRLKIKECLKTYDSVTVNKLNIPTTIKSFLLFDEELQTVYARNKQFLNQVNGMWR